MDLTLLQQKQIFAVVASAVILTMYFRRGFSGKKAILKIFSVSALSSLLLFVTPYGLVIYLFVLWALDTLFNTKGESGKAWQDWLRG